MGFPDSSVGKESACNAGNPVLIPGLGKCPGVDRLPTPVFWPGEFTKSWTQLSDFHFHMINPQQTLSSMVKN